MDGLPHRVINHYNRFKESNLAEVAWNDPAMAPGNRRFRFHAVRVRNAEGAVSAEIDSSKDFSVEIDYWNLCEGAKMGATVVLYNQDGVRVFSSLSNQEPQWHAKPRPAGLFRSVCRVPGNLLPSGRFSVSSLLWGDNYSDLCTEDNLVQIDVHDTGGARGDFLGDFCSVIQPLLEWKTEIVEPTKL
jgi:hypothetical protein